MPLLKLSGRRPARLKQPDSVESLPPPPRTPNCASSHPDAGPRHKVEALSWPGPAAEALQVLREIVAGEASATLEHFRAGRYLYATYRSATLGFVDDLELLATEEEGTTRIDVRSASRLGIRDFGVNRRRVEELRRQLRARANAG